MEEKEKEREKDVKNDVKKSERVSWLDTIKEAFC